MNLINEEIILNFEMPKEIQNIIDKIKPISDKYKTEEEFPAEEYLSYMILIQHLEIVSKKCVNAGKITAFQKEMIFEKYNVFI
ncbi:MAG: hypothetical protein EOM50_09115 [Erysipelotrichia bacterium]|nr:hypothetical protein [Erysipelotrichia bacterium]NCC54797.1 hypothetical protein [Erysipelotrichia bacterium]